MNADQNRLEQAQEQRRQTMKPEIVDVTEQKRLNEAREKGCVLVHFRPPGVAEFEFVPEVTRYFDILPIVSNLFPLLAPQLVQD